MTIKIHHEGFPRKHLLGKILDATYKQLIKPEAEQYNIVGYIFDVDDVTVCVSVRKRKTLVSLYITEEQ